MNIIAFRSKYFLFLVSFIILVLLYWFFLPQGRINKSIYWAFIFFNTLVVAGFYFRQMKLSGRISTVINPGLIFLFVLYFYILFPGLTLGLGLEDFTPIGWYNFSNLELVSHFLRLIIFSSLVALFLVIFSSKLKFGYRKYLENTSSFLFLSLVISYFLILVLLLSLSGTVDSYYDHYLRYDHLDGFSRALVSILKRSYWGVMPFLVYLAAVQWKESKFTFMLFIILICYFDLIISYGSRINTIMIIIQAFISFVSISGKAPSFKVIFFFLVFGLLSMTFIELIRLYSSSSSFLDKESPVFYLPGELLALYFPSIHLYDIFKYSFPWSDSLIYFKDFIQLVPFIKADSYNLMNWYWLNYHDTSPVAPYTMGIFAESALYGDWWILIQALFVALILDNISKLILSDNRISRITFIYFTSISFLVLKYGLFAYINLFLKNFLVGIFIYYLCYRLTFFLKKTSF